MVELTRKRIDPAELMRRIKTVDAGAVAVFCGDVRRDGPEENPLVALDYSAHEEMALVLQAPHIHDPRVYAIMRCRAL